MPQAKRINRAYLYFLVACFALTTSIHLCANPPQTEGNRTPSFSSDPQSTDTPEQSADRAELNRLMKEIRAAKNPTPKKLGQVEEAVLISQRLGDHRAQFDCFLTFSSLCNRQGDFEQSSKWIEKAELLSSFIGDNYGLSKLLAVKGDAYNYQRDYLNAIKCFRQAYPLAVKQEQTVQQAVLQTEIAAALNRLGAYNEAADAYQRALDTCQRCKFASYEPEIKLEIANILLKLKQYDEAEERFKELIHANSQVALSAKQGIAEIAYRKGNIDEAIAEANKLLELGDSRTALQKGNLHLILARALNENGKLDHAKANCEQAIPLLESDAQGKANSQIVMAEIQMNQGNKYEAVLRLSKLVENSSGREKLKALDKLSQFYENLADINSALEQNRLASVLRKEILQRRTKIRLELARTSHQCDLKIQELAYQASQDRANRELSDSELEKATLKQKQLNQEIAQTNRLTNIGLVGAGLLLTGLFLYFRLDNRRQKTQLQLESAEKQIQLEQQLAKKKRMESIGLLTGNVAHDINNLLQVVSQNHYLLKSSLGNGVSTEQHRLLGSIEASAEIGARITSQLLQFARQRSLRPEVARVDELLESAHPLFCSIAGDQISIQTRFSDPLLAICVDRPQLNNSIINLLLNAKDAMDGRGKIEIHVHQKTFDQAQASKHSVEPGEYVLIDVTDNGRGMSKDQLAKACDPFFTTKELDTGNGLGLSSVSGFVDQSKGGLLITSEPEKGTTVSMAFPSAFVIGLHGVHDAEEPKIESPQQSKEHFLIVEDNESVRESLMLMIQHSGATTTCVGNVDEAIAVLEKPNNISAVISDVRMPGKLTGIDLANWIVENELPPAIILVSGNSQAQTINNHTFLQKPYTFDQLLNAISDAFEKNKPA